MSPRIDFAKVIPCTNIRGDNDEDTELLKSMHQEAENYLASFEWCLKITKCYFGFGVGGVVGSSFWLELEHLKSIGLGPEVWNVVPH